PDDTFPHQGTQLGTHQRGEAAWRKPGIGSDGQARRGHVFVRSDNQYRCRGRPADFRRHVDEVATIQEYGICGWLAKQSACLSSAASVRSTIEIVWSPISPITAGMGSDGLGPSIKDTFAIPSAWSPIRSSSEIT